MTSDQVVLQAGVWGMLTTPDHRKYTPLCYEMIDRTPDRFFCLGYCLVTCCYEDCIGLLSIINTGNFLIRVLSVIDSSHSLVMKV
jgi:hypothetical protein